MGSEAREGPLLGVREGRAGEERPKYCRKREKVNGLGERGACLCEE